LGEIPRVEWHGHDWKMASKGRKKGLLGKSQGGRVFGGENVRVDLEGWGGLVVKGGRCTEG
jgi:hypothetical protein